MWKCLVIAVAKGFSVSIFSGLLLVFDLTVLLKVFFGNSLEFIWRYTRPVAPFRMSRELEEGKQELKMAHQRESG